MSKDLWHETEICDIFLIWREGELLQGGVGGEVVQPPCNVRLTSQHSRRTRGGCRGMFHDPGGEQAITGIVRGRGKPRQGIEILAGCLQGQAIAAEKEPHRLAGDAFVAVTKGMIRDQQKDKGGSLVGETGKGFLPKGGLKGRRERREQPRGIDDLETPWIIDGNTVTNIYQIPQRNMVGHAFVTIRCSRTQAITSARA